jgi:hypothetical protein
MGLNAKQIQENWGIFINYIDEYIESPRQEKLKEFYTQYQERLMLMPASHKKEYHNSFPGGYIEHVNRVIECALKLHTLWEEMGANVEKYTLEELVFSAINHDLGKMGDENFEAYVPQTDSWRKEKLGENYMYNMSLPFASVPDRGLYLLQAHGITYSFNEMLAIQTHDGLYDEANKKYLMGFLPEQKPRTCIPFILHQADLMAARIEFEREWLNNGEIQPKKQVNTQKTEKNKTTEKIKNKALKSIKSEGLMNMLDNI